MASYLNDLVNKLQQPEDGRPQVSALGMRNAAMGGQQQQASRLGQMSAGAGMSEGGGLPAPTGYANTGISGGMPVLGAPPVADAPDPAAVDRVKGQLAGVFGSMGPSTAAPAAAPQFNTRLMEGDPGKLADVAHAASSPKYDFLQLAQKGTHDYNDLGGMLKDLQGGANSKLWQGWSANGDKLKFGGDPSQLDPSWNGVREVDAIGGMHDPNGPQGFRWGVEDPRGAQGAPAMNAGRPSLAGGGLNSMLQGNAQAGIQQALAGYGGGQNDYLQKLIAQLQGAQ